MGKPKPPKPPDPKETAAAQSQMNQQTAITQYQLGATNQNTPWGSLSYQQVGTWPDGTPRFEATTAFSPEQQKLYDLSTQLQGKLGTIGNNQADAVAGTLSTPFRLGNEETEARLFELGRKRLDPLHAERQQRFEQNLADRGIKMGSDAYSREMERLTEGENDAYNQLLLTGRAQAANESLAERNQPLTELMSLLSGTQPHAPQFQSTPAPGVANVDYAGLVQNNYGNQLQAWQAQRQQMLGGLFGLGASFIGGIPTSWGRGGSGRGYTGNGLY